MRSDARCLILDKSKNDALKIQHPVEDPDVLFEETGVQYQLAFA
jgi:hypothetical protein